MSQHRIAAILALWLFVLAGIATGQPKMNLIINGQKSQSGPPPQLIKGRVMLPLQAICKGLGAKVLYAPGFGVLLVRYGSTSLRLEVNSPLAMMNKQAIYLDAPVTVSQGRVLVPLTLLSDNLGLDVHWVRASNTVSITKSKNRSPNRLPLNPKKGKPGSKGFVWPEVHLFGPCGVAQSRLAPIRSPGSLPLQPGDIALRGEYLTNQGFGFYFTHSGIVGEDLKIIHVTGLLFADATSIDRDTPEEYWKTSYAGAVIRPRVSSEQRLRAAKWAAGATTATVKFKIDAAWPSDPAGDEYVNCSSFVERAYRIGAGADLGLMNPITAGRTRTGRTKFLTAGRAVRGAEEFFTTPYEKLWLVTPKGNLCILGDRRTAKWEP